MERLNKIIENYKNKDKNVKGAIKRDLVINLIIIIFLKTPFNMVRDYGYDKVEILRKDYYDIWNNGIFILYLIILIIVIIYIYKRIIKKYSL